MSYLFISILLKGKKSKTPNNSFKTAGPTGKLINVILYHRNKIGMASYFTYFLKGGRGDIIHGTDPSFELHLKLTAQDLFWYHTLVTDKSYRYL